MPSSSNQAPDDRSVAQSVQPLDELCRGVLPVWARHLATSRAQSEVAVTQMLQAFADIGPHIDRAERQSRQITEALSQSDGGMTWLTVACERTLTPVLKDPQLPATAAAAIGATLDMVRRAVAALEEIAKPFAHETHMVAEQVERMYMGFQYQDRISQMMVLLEADIARMQEAFSSQDPNSLDLAQWLQRLESQYAMSEQHRDHQGIASADSAGADDGETTFF